MCVVLKVYDIKKSQQSDLYFAGSFCLVYQAKLTNSKRYILHICDFSRWQVECSLPCSHLTFAPRPQIWNMFYFREISPLIVEILTFWNGFSPKIPVMFCTFPGFSLIERPSMSEKIFPRLLMPSIFIPVFSGRRS